MENNQDTQAQIDELKKRLDQFNSSQTIPLSVDQSWKVRGFIKTDFFVAGVASFDNTGTYRLTIPGATINSIVLVTPFIGSGAVEAQIEQAYSSTTYGASNSQYDVTNPAGTTYRYTWDTNGTNPNINLTTLPIGSQVTIFGTWSAVNQGTFITTGGGVNYFEVNNPIPGVVENNKTGFVVGGPLTTGYGILVEGTPSTLFSFIVFLFNKLYVAPWNP